LKKIQSTQLLSSLRFIYELEWTHWFSC